MTSPSLAVPFSGMVSVLAIWSLVVVGIGLSLFIYGIIVTLRDRRYGRRLRGRGRPRKSAPAGRRPGGTGARPARPRRPPDNLPARLPARPLPRREPAPPGPSPAPYPMPSGYPRQALPAAPAMGEPARLALPSAPVTDQPVWPPSSPAPASPAGPVTYGLPPGWDKQPAEQVAPPGRGRKGGRRKRPDCAQLRAECLRLRQEADAAVAAAEAGARQLADLRTHLAAASSAREAAEHAYQRAVRETAEAVARTRIEHTPTPEEQEVAGTTTHAAFAAYRRGDINAEQLREVFRRAEGWTPEHDRLVRDASQRKADEADALKVVEQAQLLERSAAERVQVAAVSARALDEEAQAAVDEARAACTAAANCR